MAASAACARDLRIDRTLQLRADGFADQRIGQPGLRLGAPPLASRRVASASIKVGWVH